MPRSNERAGIAVIGTRMDGFEIKTERDTLRRLPRQASAYARLLLSWTRASDFFSGLTRERHSRTGRPRRPVRWECERRFVQASAASSSAKVAQAR